MFFYPDNNKKELFPEILNKYEFESNSEDKRKDYIYQEPYQLFMRNYMSLYTPYESVLLYAYLGTGKTCTAISIAEGFKEYVMNMGRKIFVLVKNQNIKKNFFNELLSSCTRSDYLNDIERNIYFNTNRLNDYDSINDKKELTNRVNKTINKSYNFVTYGKFVNSVLGMKEFEKDSFGNNTKTSKRSSGKVTLTNLNNTVIIVDEAHNITNTDVYIALKKILTNSYNYRLILLTATPISDNPKEIFEISNLLNINNVTLQLPIRNELFKPDIDNNVLIQRAKSRNLNNNLLKGGIINVTHYGKKKLLESLYGKVSHIQANTDTNPVKIEMGVSLTNIPGSIKIVYCPMSEYQYKIYLQGVKSDIKSVDTDITTINNGGIMGGIYKNSSDASTMCYPDNKYGKEGFTSVFTERNGNLKLMLKNDLKKYSNKIFTLLENVKKSKGNVFIFTNYVSNGGTSLLREIFLLFGYTEFKNNIEGVNSQNFIIFDESTTPETREKYRLIFNHPSNKDGRFIKIIIGSPIISEGITLKNVRQIHLLEPSWNMSRINQIIGRAVRNYSHHDLELQDRNVEIYKYASIYENPDAKFKFFIDKEKYILSEEKDRSNKIIERLLKRLSFDCEFFKTRNTKDSIYDHTADCDYVKCNYNCMVKKNETSILDKSTYRLNIDFFDKFDITYVTENLRELFSKYFIWKLDDIVSFIKNKNDNISFDVIYHTISNIVENKMFFTDAYNRDGFIVNKGDFYIFNPIGVDINESLYTKMFDFSININKYNLDEFVKKAYNKNIFDEKSKKVLKKEKKQEEPMEELTEQQIKYNENIMNNNELYGTFRKFNKKGDKFLLVDLRKSKGKQPETSDKRKQINGMAITSFKKPQLIDIMNYLEIDLNNDVELSTYSIQELSSFIEKELVKRKLVMF